MMNSIGLQQELRRRQIELCLQQQLDMHKISSRLDMHQGSLLMSSGARSPSFHVGDLLGLTTSPRALLPTFATGDHQANLLSIVNNRRKLLASPVQDENMALLSKLKQLGTSLPPRHPATLCSVPVGRVEPFPEKLHRLLLEVESLGRTDIISFIEDDTFRIHDQETFFREVVPRYFRQTKLTSFKRQLKLYGFELISHGSNKGGYRHALFSKKDPEKCHSMKRVAIKTPKSTIKSTENQKTFQG